MSGLALIAVAHHADRQRVAVQGMIDAVPHRSTDGRCVVVAPRCALGFARHASTPREQSAAWPWHEAGADSWVVADLRLDNRTELGEQVLGFGAGEVTDAQIVLAGYRKWQNELASHLVGDFALAIWNETAGSLYAARDPFGIRPLFYYRATDFLALASEVEQLLSLEQVVKEIDERAVADYLTGETHQRRATFFRGIQRVEPGHWLLARQGNVVQQRYWQAPRGQRRRQPAAECQSEFRQRFFRSVRDRLTAPGPVVVHLSGGIDSSAMVGAAWQLAQDHGVGRDACRLASAVYPGLPCDESRYIEAVRERVQFPCESWDGTETAVPVADCPLAAHPWGMGKFGSVAGDWRVARRCGARVILSGFGGDELLFERGIFADLAAAGRWLELLRQSRLAPRYSTRMPQYFVQSALRSVVPATLRDCFRRWRPAPTPLAPSWWGKKLRELAAVGTDDGPAESAPSFASHTQETTWNWLTRPEFLQAIEWQVLEAGREGLELRFPYLDRRLVEFVLRLPYEQRLPHGRMKRLLRDALCDELPACVAERRHVTTFAANIELQFRRSLPAVTAILKQVPWHSDAYVDQAGALQLLEQLAAAPTGTLDWTEIATVWNIALLERWLQSWQPKIRNAP